MNTFWIAASLILAIMLVGTLMTIPALYRREANKQEERA